MPLLSIIVPVFMVEKYLQKCIDSILKQTFNNFELILVNDGSPDNSGKICNQNAQIDCRIKVIHKENNGLSSARNAGVSIARGDYIMFIDSDDFLLNDKSLNKLAERINSYNEDLIICSCMDIFPSNKSNISRGNYNINIINIHDKNRTIDYLVDNNNFPGAAWLICAKRELLELNNIQFPLNVTAEDYIWILKIIKHAKTIGAVNETIIAHLMYNPNSITSCSRVSGTEGMHIAITYWEEHINEWTQSINNMIAKLSLIALINYNGLPHNDKQKWKKIVKNDIKALKKSNLALYILIYYISNIIGINILSKIIAKLYKINTNKNL